MSKVTAPELTSYAGATVSIGTSLTLTQWGVVAGIVTALLGAPFFLFLLVRGRS